MSQDEESDADLELDVEAVLEDLRERHEDIGRHVNARQHFTWGVRGGLWLAANRGLSFDNYRA